MIQSITLLDYIISNSYTMGTSGLPDMYTRSPRAEGVYIRQITSAHGITKTYQSMCNHVWANQHNNSSMDSLYLYRDLLDCIVGLNLIIKTFFLETCRSLKSKAFAYKPEPRVWFLTDFEHGSIQAIYGNGCWL